MAEVPSIQGAVLAGDVELLNKLLAEGATTREALARRLAKEELALLERRIAASEWLDVRSADRILQVLRDVKGEGDHAFLVRHGWETAERLLAAGLYQQLQYLSRASVRESTDPRERFIALGTDLRLLTTLAATIYNFTKWTPRPDPEHRQRYRIEIADAAAFPTTLCFTTAGFLDRATSEGRSGEPLERWTWSRPQPDLVVYRMTRDV